MMLFKLCQTTIYPLLLYYLLGKSSAAKFSIINECTYTVWPATLSNAGTTELAASDTGFSLPPGAINILNVPSSWSGRMWGRTLCNSGGNYFSCATGDCGTGLVACSGSGAHPPATLAEFTLNGSGGLDFYDVSLVDGYNLPLMVRPVGGSGNCTSTGCVVDLNRSCPVELRVVSSGSDAQVGAGVACKSACEAFGDPQYCCSGPNATPDKCQPSKYSEFFKQACPTAYSYAYDDATSTFTCLAPDYVITFCPSSTPTGKSSETQSPEPSADLPRPPPPYFFFVNRGNSLIPSSVLGGLITVLWPSFATLYRI